MIRLADIRTTLAEIKELVEQKVFHPYLLKFIQTPQIDEDKLLILISILDKLELSNNQMQNYALTTMLIQIALDTHEDISNDQMNEEEKDSLKIRQLTVLAGDYYSGLYYKLLAETDDIQMIKALARGIKEINENKITVFQKEFDSIEKLMSSIKVIESALITQLLEYFHMGSWNEVVTNLFFVKRLLNERNQFIKIGSSLVFDGLKKISFPKSDIKVRELSNEQQSYLLNICDRYIDFSKHMVEKGLKQIPNMNELVEDRITQIVHQHNPPVKSFVEEG
ncbi:heptaprenyl diphosphate synthase component 1 [Neobacillus sp. PS3-40]|uniref:heptaprenyl diphosphate synthase component 1 n=1 Tax=Neobacillus sp. PS3-40 TaxID=3070679 RepID=UPI0027E1EE9E|nr:heptaprenyl diphosphate synthase component 1 [Neobacillus sp. PS3-40]WML45115.1 heptaprenyl diphosphate synthase component 1 [Neobacillus sp. PS3-40]